MIAPVLGEEQRGQIWLSTLSGALYRWAGECWEFKPMRSAEWMTSFDRPTVVYAHAGEEFVSDDAPE